MTLLDDFRAKYPQYADIPDGKLAGAIRKKYYSDMPADMFYRKAGLAHLVGIDEEKKTAAQEMTRAEQVGAGVGKSVRDTGLGIAQLALHGGPGGLVGEWIGKKLGAPGVKIPGQQYIDERINANQQADAELLDTGGGLGGYVGGTIATSMIPGGAAMAGGKISGARGLVSAGKAVLAPSTYYGAAGVGAVQGMAQPVGEDESRLLNTGVGAVAGPAGLGLTRGIGATYRGLASLFPAARRGAQEQKAAKAILDMAHDPNAVRAALGQSGEIIPGSLPTTAELTRDTGLAGLQRTMENTPEFANELTARNLQRNAVRTDYIRQNFGGATDDAARKLMDARDMAAAPLRKQAEKATGVNTASVISMAEKMAASKRGAPTIQAAIDDAKSLLLDPKTGNPLTDVKSLYNARKEIGYMLDGMTDKPAHKAAKQELMLIRGYLDRQIRKAAPEFGQYMKGYRAASKEADRVKVGATLLDKSNASLDKLGNPTLSTAKIAGAADDMDALVRQATGFRKASADRTLLPQQQKAIGALRSDLDRQAMTAVEGKAVGSNTVQNLMGQGRFQEGMNPVAGAMIQTSGPASAAIGVLNGLRKQYGDRTMALAQEAMLDPQKAAQYISMLPPNQQQAVRRSIAPLLSSSMAASLLSALGLDQEPLDASQY